MATFKKQLDATRLFLTYPKCSLSKERLAELLQTRVGDKFKGLRVCHELHEDGTDHLHCLLLLKDSLRTRDARYFDFEGYHPNVQPARSGQAVKDYVAKGGDFLDVGDLKCRGLGGSGKSNRSDTAAKLVAEGATFEEVFDAVPGFALTNKRKIEELVEWVKNKKAKTSLVPLPMLAADLAEGPEKEIAEWMDSDLHGGKRELKRPQLYIHGPPSVGKTTLVQLLAKYLRIYVVPQDENFYDYYNDAEFDLIVFDEFKGNQKSLQWLNQFIDGSFMTVRKKGLQTFKAKNLPVLFLSNFTPQQAFSQAASKGSVAFDAFLTRIRVVHVTTFMVDLTQRLTPSSPTTNPAGPSSDGALATTVPEELEDSPIDLNQPYGSEMIPDTSQQSIFSLNNNVVGSLDSSEEEMSDLDESLSQLSGHDLYEHLNKKYSLD